MREVEKPPHLKESETEESTDPITVGIVIANTGPFAELRKEVDPRF